MATVLDRTDPLTSAHLWARTRRTIAGGGASNMRNAGFDTPLVVERSAGCRLWDVEGRELIDVNMGYGPHLFGYADPDVLDAVAHRLSLGAITGLPHRLDHEAGELIAALVPGVEQVRLANSGTEAITSALRLARFVTGRPLVVTFEGHYHGWSETVLRRSAVTSGGAGDGAGGGPGGAGGAGGVAPGAPGMIPGALTHTLQLPWNDPDALDAAFARHGDRIAAVIVEPVCANAGVVPPRPGLLEHLAGLTAGHGALLVFDEVITGFRLAAGGAQERFGIVPDLTILSKVLGGGFPVAAFGGPRAVMAPLARNEAFHAGVYAGNHAAAASVVATLTKIAAHRDVYDRLEADGAELEGRLRDVFAAAGRPVRIARAGSVLSVALLTGGTDGAGDRDGDGDGTADLTHDAAVARIDFAGHRRLQATCQEAGVYFHPNPLEPWFLSAAHGPAERDTVVACIADALERR